MLLIDDRESNKRIDAVKTKIPDAEVKRLDVGDYIFGDLGVECKEIGDFCESVKENKVFRQLTELATNYQKPILVIIGDIEDHILQLRNTVPKFKFMKGNHWYPLAESIRSRYYSALDSIAKSHHVGIIHFPTDARFAEWLARSIKREEAPPKDFQRPIETRKPSDRTLAEEQEDMLVAITHVGRKTAKSLLLTFGSIRGVCEATPEQLRGVSGVGPNTSSHLIDLLAYNSKTP